MTIKQKSRGGWADWQAQLCPGHPQLPISSDPELCSCTWKEPDTQEHCMKHDPSVISQLLNSCDNLQLRFREKLGAEPFLIHF